MLYCVMIFLNVIFGLYVKYVFIWKFYESAVLGKEHKKGSIKNIWRTNVGKSF